MHAVRLMITGWQVSRGYLNKPEKTAESIQRIFMTMQKAMKCCIIQVMWQDIFQMEISRSLEERTPRLRSEAFRIELSEVEEVIRRYEGIRDATVVAFDDPKAVENTLQLM